MAFFEGLKKIIPAKVAEESFEFDLKLSNSKSKSEVNFKVDKKNKILTIYLNKLTFKENEILKKHLLKDFGFNKLKFVESDSIDLITKLIAYNKKDDGKTLNFFENILTPNDLLALRDSLFLRDEFYAGNNVSSLKSDISYAHGERGNIISNLCSAGYFEEVMIPLYNRSKTDFHEFYDLAVDRGVKALFVNGRMSVTDITTEIERRLVSAHSSGLKSINIHGIGEKNVQNIKKSLSAIIEKGKSNFLRKNIAEESNVIIVEMILS